MPKLPSMVVADDITSSLQVTFGSYNHTKAAGNGDIYDMKNLSSDRYPLLAPRKKRRLYSEDPLERPNGLYARDGLYYVDGTSFYAHGEFKGTVSDTKKQFCSLGAYIVILPDKKYYNTEDDTFGSIEVAYSSADGKISFTNGTIYGENAEANTICSSSADCDFGKLFKVGDAVTISGCSEHPENNIAVVIREISEDGKNLVFYENTFSLNTDSNNVPIDYTEPGSITISRTMPDMAFICENENRLWGCKGNEIYACKPGDIFNWNVFDGLSTDSYAASVGSSGDFTGCYSYLGYPCFFKDSHIYKVYGDKPSNFQVMASSSMGVSSGSGNSFAIAGEMLFYLSRTGICAYSGGMPGNAASVFGEDKYVDAVGGSDGTKYYVSMKNIATDKYSLFVYDTRCGLWHREDDTQVVSFAWDSALYFLDAQGCIKCIDNGTVSDLPFAEDVVEWEAEFADICEYSTYRSRSTPIASKKGVSKFMIRLELEKGAYVEAKLKFDSEGDWISAGVINATKKKSFILPIIPRRTDHYRLKLCGKGMCVLYSIKREYYPGSDL